MEPVSVQTCVFGSYISALARKSVALSPPVTSTLPLDNSVAVCWYRGTFIEPVRFHCPLIGSNSSALAMF